MNRKGIEMVSLERIFITAALLIVGTWFATLFVGGVESSAIFTQGYITMALSLWLWERF